MGTLSPILTRNYSIFEGNGHLVFLLRFFYNIFMSLQLLISALNAEESNLIQKMNVSGNAVLINQNQTTNTFEIPTKNGVVSVFCYDERGVGLSRNHALSNATDELILFSDDDIVYVDDYESLIEQEFCAHPEADILFFNVEVEENRRTYHIESFGPVTYRNSGRFPTYALAARRERLIDAKVSFSPLFGGGAKYSCGEDSLFIMDCLKAGLKCYQTPVTVGREEYRESTWFHGYNEKLFFDRGVLYHFLYGRLAVLMAIRFLLKHKSRICTEVPAKRAFKLMREGIIEGKTL